MEISILLCSIIDCENDDNNIISLFMSLRLKFESLINFDSK
jgi:hypothetical protein